VAKEIQTTDAAWSAAFGLSWLIGYVHELAVFHSRIAEYEKNGSHILRALVRTSLKNRNKRFGANCLWQVWNISTVGLCLALFFSLVSFSAWLRAEQLALHQRLSASIARVFLKRVWPEIITLDA
jgi:hypothetical protein